MTKRKGPPFSPLASPRSAVPCPKRSPSVSAHASSCRRATWATASPYFHPPHSPPCASQRSFRCIACGLRPIRMGRWARCSPNGAGELFDTLGDPRQAARQHGVSHLSHNPVSLSWSGPGKATRGTGESGTRGSIRGTPVGTPRRDPLIDQKWTSGQICQFWSGKKTFGI